MSSTWIQAIALILSPISITALILFLGRSATKQYFQTPNNNLMAGFSHAQAVVGMSDAMSAVIDDLQFTVGEGPCHDALRTGRPVHSSDLTTERRWPGWKAATPGGRSSA